MKEILRKISDTQAEYKINAKEFNEDLLKLKEKYNLEGIKERELEYRLELLEMLKEKSFGTFIKALNSNNEISKYKELIGYSYKDSIYKGLMFLGKFKDVYGEYDIYADIQVNKIKIFKHQWLERDGIYDFGTNKIQIYKVELS